MRKQLAFNLTTSAAVRSLWSALPAPHRGHLITLLARLLARAAKAESGREKKGARR